MKDRVKLILEVEYKPDSGYYPEGATLENMVKIDLEHFKDEPKMFLSEVDKVNLKYEILEG